MVGGDEPVATSFCTAAKSNQSYFSIMLLSLAGIFSYRSGVFNPYYPFQIYDSGCRAKHGPKPPVKKVASARSDVKSDLAQPPGWLKEFIPAP